MDANRQSPTSHPGRLKRIAINTLLLFVRFAFLMLIDLFAVRYVLRGLGQEDYGIYSAVASVVFIGACLRPVLSLSVQRYFSYSLGERDLEKFADIYSVSLNIIAALIAILVVVFESGGLLFFYQLTIPAERLSAALWTFHTSLAAFLFTFLQIPYMAAIFANEDMGAYTVISAAECVLKFLVAVCLLWIGIDALVFYGLGLMAVSVLTFLAYFLYAKLRYSTLRYRLRIATHGLYRSLLSFSGWTMYGAVAGMGMIQGGAILLNVFFGPIVNAAFGLVLTIYNAFNSIANAIVVAFRPAMVKAYAEGQHDYLNRIFSIGNRALAYLLIAAAVPLCFEMPYVLRLWLVEYPEQTVLFGRLIVVFAVILALNNPITTIIQANGNIRSYFLLVETITVLNVPLAFLVFHLGAPAYSLFVVMIALCTLAHGVRLYCLKSLYPHFSLAEYTSRLLLPVALTLVAATAGCHLIHINMCEGAMRLLAITAAAVAIIAVLVALCGLTARERSQLTSSITRKLKLS